MFRQVTTLTTAILALVALLPSPASPADRSQWVGTWAASPAGPLAAGSDFMNVTLRDIVHISAGGSRVRIRVSNSYGDGNLIIASTHLALRSRSSSIVPETDRRVTFGGRQMVRVPVGAMAISDPVDLTVPDRADMAVSFYLMGAPLHITAHGLALQTSYSAAGQDAAGSADLPGAVTMGYWPILAGVDVSGSRARSAIVTLGDSITDGANSTADTNRRWPDLLADRLLRAGRSMGVLNAGISGNRILHPGTGRFVVFGEAALTRFDRDVVAQPGVKYLIVLEGINDIGHPGSAAPMSEAVTAEDIIAGMRQIIERAHEKGIKVFGGTITPFAVTTIENYYSEDKEKKREQVNDWIRTSGAFDAVIDFDRAVRDPAHPNQWVAAYDSGDHLHPSDAGCKAMADAVNLSLLR